MAQLSTFTENYCQYWPWNGIQEISLSYLVYSYKTILTIYTLLEIHRNHDCKSQTLCQDHDFPLCATISIKFKFHEVWIHAESSEK